MIKFVLVIAFLGLAASQEAEKKPEKEGAADTRLFLGGGGNFGPPHGQFGSVGGIGGSFGGGRPFIGGGGRPTGGFGNFGGRPSGGLGHGSFGGRPVGGIGGGIVSPHFPGGLGFQKEGCSSYCKNPDGSFYCCKQGAQTSDIVGTKPGRCPAVRHSCPGTKLGPEPCDDDYKCHGTEKCCYDRCLERHVCKPIILGTEGIFDQPGHFGSGGFIGGGQLGGSHGGGHPGGGQFGSDHFGGGHFGGGQFGGDHFGSQGSLAGFIRKKPEAAATK